jgi:uncharacterized protein (TIGR02996 family)
VTDLESLLRAVCEHPVEDTPRLMYADEVQEPDPTRAEFVRVNIKIWRLPATAMFCERAGKYSVPNLWTWSYTPRCRCGACTLARRNYNLGKRHVVWDWTKGVPAGCVNQWRRGFIEHIRITTVHFMGHAAAIFAAHPVTSVVLTDAEIFPSGGNDTFYLGGLGRLPQKYWPKLEGHPTRQAVADAASACLVAHGRELAGLPPLPDRTAGGAA